MAKPTTWRPRIRLSRGFWRVIDFAPTTNTTGRLQRWVDCENWCRDRNYKEGRYPKLQTLFVLGNEVYMEHK